MKIDYSLTQWTICIILFSFYWNKTAIHFVGTSILATAPPTGTLQSNKRGTVVNDWELTGDAIALVFKKGAIYRKKRQFRLDCIHGLQMQIWSSFENGLETIDGNKNKLAMLNHKSIPVASVLLILEKLTKCVCVLVCCVCGSLKSVWGKMRKIVELTRWSRVTN